MVNNLLFKSIEIEEETIQQNASHVNTICMSGVGGDTGKGLWSKVSIIILEKEVRMAIEKIMT